MPWVVKKNDGKFCVYKTGDSTPIKGGCHASRSDAVKHMRALYANVKDFSEPFTDDMLCSLVPLKFSETELVDGKLTKWVQVLPYSSWDHPLYGMSYFHKWNADNMVRNFHEGVHGTQTLHTDFEHGLTPRGTISSGTILDMEARDSGLWWYIEFTKQASQEILNGEWNYLSPEYNDIWENPMDGIIHSDVARGGGLTNKPWVKGLVPINLSEVLAERGAIVVNPEGEVSWEEHHDPGQDPHEKPKPEDEDKAAKSGSRRETPPIEKEQEASMKLSAAALTALGLAEDATEEQINTALDGAVTELEGFRASKAEQDQKDEEAKVFSEKYPEQAAKLTEQEAELKRLRQRENERDAESFGKRFSEFTVKVPSGEKDDDGKDIETEVRKGFSSLICEQLTELHKKFSEGTATPDDLVPILDKIVAGDGIVEYGERGSSVDNTGEEEAANPQEAAKKLSELAWAKVHASEGTDKPITYGDALADVMKSNPELTKTYTGKEG